MERRGHKINPDEFCYICARFINGPKRQFNENLQLLYWKYFKSSCLDLQKEFTPSYICSTCQRYLYEFKNNPLFCFPFSCPAIWTEFSSHENGECYFCTTKRPALKRKAEYNNCSNCKIPKSTAPDLATRSSQLHLAIDTSDEECFDENDSDFVPNINCEFEWSMDTFNDFCRELNLTRRKSKKCLQMLRKDSIIKSKLANISMRQIDSRNHAFIPLFSNVDGYAFCNDIEGLFNLLGVNYSSCDWCLFIDGSSFSLKAALMSKNNQYPTIPLVYCKVKESRESLKKILDLIKYEDNNWITMCDLKVTNYLSGLKSGYAKHPCLYCMFDTRNSQPDFDASFQWDERTDFDCNPLINIQKIALPPLHIKLGLFQQFVKALPEDSDCSLFLHRKFNKSEAKISNGVFNGPEIRSLMNDVDFSKHLDQEQMGAWLCFCDVATNVLGKNVSNNWMAKVDNLIASFALIGVSKMTSKMHFIFKHKEKIEPYLGQYSDENGERLHQEMQSFEKRFCSDLSTQMMAEYMWSMKRDTSHFTSSKVVIHSEHP